MAIDVGTNSWITLAEADAYLADRVDATDFFVLTDVGEPGEPSKMSYLVTAFRWLRNSRQLSLSDSLSDAVVKNAQCEAALFLIKYQNEWEDREAAIASGISSLTMSRRREELDINRLSIPQRILDMLQDYTGGTNFVTLEGEYDT